MKTPSFERFSKKHEAQKEDGELLKFPKIPHLPWSCSVTKDDRLMTPDQVVENFEGKTLVYMEKLDGENTCMSSDQIRARSVSGAYGRPWQVTMQKRWEAIRNDIPEGFTIYGENMTGVHSVEYDNLTDFFYVFGMTDGSEYLSFEEVGGYAAELGLKVAPTIKIGPLEELSMPETSEFGPVCEGYVVRNSESFQVPDEWEQNIGKCVREGHVQPESEHWTKGWKRARINWQ